MYDELNAETAIRKVLAREVERMQEEASLAQAAEPLSEEEAHRPVSNRVATAEAAAAEPSFGSMGDGGVPPADGAREEVTEPRERQEAAEFFDESAAVDAYWGSFGDAADRELLREVGPQLEIVLGGDDRVEVTNNQAYPWRCICSLRMVAASGANFIGTGWLVSPRVVLTAGHCVFFHNHGGWARSVEVIPGRRGSQQPFGSAFAQTLRSVRGWTQSRSRDLDYGAIILPDDRRFGEQLGWFGYSVRTDAELEDRTLNLSGYPGDKPSGTQWFHARTVKSLTPQRITYEIDTAGGQSGAPVWQVLQNGARYGVGIHTNGSQLGNSATRITSSVFSNVSEWIRQAP